MKWLRKNWLAVGSSAVGGVFVLAALITIIQFLTGGTSVCSLLCPPKPTPAPTPIPVIAEIAYQSASIGCAKNDDTSDLYWSPTGATTASCTTDNTGRLITTANPTFYAKMRLIAATGLEFHEGETITVNVSNIAANSCAGIGTRESRTDERGYAFYICSNGAWYIIKYAPDGSPLPLPTTLVTGSKLDQTPNHTLVVTVSGNTLQVTVDNDLTFESSDAEYTVTQEVSLNVAGSDTIITPQPSSYTASAVFSQFSFKYRYTFARGCTLAGGCNSPVRR